MGLVYHCCRPGIRTACLSGSITSSLTLTTCPGWPGSGRRHPAGKSRARVRARSSPGPARTRPPPVPHAGHRSEDGQQPPAPRPGQSPRSWAVLANPKGNQSCVIRPKEKITRVGLALARHRWPCRRQLRTFTPSATLHKIRPSRMPAWPSPGMPTVRRALDNRAPTRRFASAFDQWCTSIRAVRSSRSEVDLIRLDAQVAAHPGRLYGPFLPAYRNGC